MKMEVNISVMMSHNSPDGGVVYFDFGPKVRLYNYGNSSKIAFHSTVRNYYVPFGIISNSVEIRTQIRKYI